MIRSGFRKETPRRASANVRDETPRWPFRNRSRCGERRDRRVFILSACGPHQRRVTTRPFSALFARFFRLLLHRFLFSAPPGAFTRRGATSNEPKHARILSRRLSDGTRHEAPARASPRAFAKRAGNPRVPILAFVFCSLFRDRRGENPVASTGAPSRGETRARRNVSARVPRERRRARAPLVRHTTPRGPLTEAPPRIAPNLETRARTSTRVVARTLTHARFSRKNNNRGRIRTASLGARTRSSGTRATRALRGPRLRRGPPRGRTCVRDPTRPPPLPRAGGRRLLLRRRAEARRARSETRISPLRRRCACLSP